MSIIKNRHDELDAEILEAAKSRNAKATEQKVALQESLATVLGKRDQAQSDFDHSKLEADSLYQKLKADNHDDMIQKMIDRTMTKEEYDALSKEHGVNQDVVEYDPEDFEARISNFKNLYHVKNQKLTADLNQGYVIYQNNNNENDPHNGKKVGMVRNEDIPKAFEEMGIEVKDFEESEEGKKEATTYLKELFKDYEDQFPNAFAEDNRFSDWNKAKFQLFDKRAKDNGLPYAGYQYSYGEQCPSGEELCSWLPVRIGTEFAYLWSFRDDQEAGCGCGGESDALPVVFL